MVLTKHMREFIELLNTHPVAYMLLEGIHMKTRSRMGAPRSIASIRRRLTPVLKKYNVERAVLFGSYARNEATKHSDVDLILVQKTRKRFLDRYIGLLKELTDAAHGPGVEPMIYTPAELERIKDRPFIRTALEEGVVIYERE